MPGLPEPAQKLSPEPWVGALRWLWRGSEGLGMQAGQDSTVQHDRERHHAPLSPQHRVGVAD